MEEQTVTEPQRFSISDIQQKTDGSFIVVCNGFPYHATQVDTPDVFRQILAMIEGGEPVADFEDEQRPPEAPEVVERHWRDGQIEALRWLRERHLDEQTLGTATTLSSEQFNQLLEYLNDLRNWPQAEAFPDSDHRPVPAAWILDYLD